MQQKSRYDDMRLIKITMVAMKMSNTSKPLGDLISLFSQYFYQAGYDLLDVPVVQDAELFLSRASSKTIQMLAMFEKQGSPFALRPEFTAIAMRQYIEHKRNDVVRWQFNGIIFTENHHTVEQQMSFGTELIGLNDPYADAEIIGLSINALKVAGITNPRILMGNVGLQKHVLLSFGLDNPALQRLIAYAQTSKEPLSADGFMRFTRQTDIQSLSDIPAQPVRQMLDVLLDSTQYGKTLGGRTRDEITQRFSHKLKNTLSAQQIDKALAFLTTWSQLDLEITQLNTLKQFLSAEDAVGQKILSNWQEAIRLLEQYGISSDSIRISPNLSQNWDYYTGIMFKIATEDGIILASGGRYDEHGYVVANTKNISAVGFTYYLADILNQLPYQQVRSLCIVATQSQKLLELVAKLRENGIRAYMQPSANPDALIVHVENDILKLNGKEYQLDNLNLFVSDVKELLIV